MISAGNETIQTYCYITRSITDSSFYNNDFIGKHLYNFSGKKPSVFSSYINRKEAQGRKMFFHVLLTNNYIREVNRLMVSCMKVPETQVHVHM